MRKAIILFASAVVLTSTACNSENAEKAVNGYISETLTDLKDQLPEELKLIDSLLLDSARLEEKIAETTNLDSLEKYKQQLLEAKNMLKEDVSRLDSISPEIREMFELNP